MSQFEQAKKLFLEALSFIDSSDFHNAELRLRDALQAAPGNGSISTNLAIVLFQQNKRAEAREFAENALAANANNLEALLLVADCHAADRSFTKALPLYKKIIALDPASPDACNKCGVVLAQLGFLVEAIDNFDQAIARDANHSDGHVNKGNTLRRLKRYEEAIRAYDRALALKPNLAAAWLGRGNVFLELRRYDEAVVAYDKALVLKPDLAIAWIGRGNVFGELKRHHEALAAYDKALALKPELEDAWLGRGNVFCELNRYDEALAAYDKALALKPDLAEAWLGRGNVFFHLKRRDEAIAAYDKAMACKPDFANAWLGYGNVFGELKRTDEALAAYDKALALKPGLEDAWLGRGNVFFELNRCDEASAAFDKALALNPDLAEAWRGRGNVFFLLKRYEEAIAAYDKAIALNPDLVAVEGDRLYAKMHLCDWSNLDSARARLIASIGSGHSSIQPFAFLAIASSPDDQLQCSRLWIAKKYPPSDAPIWQGQRYDHDRIRVAYLSADFRDHAVSYLLAGVIEQHDHKRFETIAISFGPDNPSDILTRLKGSFNRFIDVKDRSDLDVATLLRNLEIDIAVDLMGFTANSRTTIMAHRLAPIQVNYLGYPGTMGAEYIDYLISDPTLIPPTYQKNYDEKIAYLPNSYMPNDDSKRLISERIFDRAEFGLPQTGFVFCCFNNGYKLNADIFDCWARILKRVEGSVLWLSVTNATAVANLKKEANARGVNPDRLVFATWLSSMADHLARQRLADLFLDTLPYNAHTTASDALWAGLPVLTCLGETFAGRVAASLLQAVRLPELITTTPEAYEQMAIDLATHPEKLAALKRKLADNRLTMPLFDTRLFTRHIEKAYIAMYERHRAGLAPDHIVIPN